MCAMGWGRGAKNILGTSRKIHRNSRLSQKPFQVPTILTIQVNMKYISLIHTVTLLLAHVLVVPLAVQSIGNEDFPEFTAIELPNGTIVVFEPDSEEGPQPAYDYNTVALTLEEALSEGTNESTSFSFEGTSWGDEYKLGHSTTMSANDGDLQLLTVSASDNSGTDGLSFFGLDDADEPINAQPVSGKTETYNNSKSTKTMESDTQNDMAVVLENHVIDTPGNDRRSLRGSI